MLPISRPLRHHVIAVLHQAIAQPTFDGIAKPLKPNGYMDSSADIAYALRQSGCSVLTPAPNPDPSIEAHWSFPDTAEGIDCALRRGATLFWANANLFGTHPLAALPAHLACIGPRPSDPDLQDDKAATNALLLKHGLPVAASARFLRDNLLSLSESDLRARGFTFPLMLKPIRGRGSQGVTRVESFSLLPDAVAALSESIYGPGLLLEELLPGDELTVPVFPPGDYDFAGEPVRFGTHWASPPVLRTGHHAGVLPYSGLIPVSGNSRVLTPEERDHPAAVTAMQACAAAAVLFQARTTIRIDCRRSASGEYRLFDFNLKPNMTGPGRPGRDQQASLVALSTAAMGWDYAALICNIAAQGRPYPRYPESSAEIYTQRA